MRRNADHHSQTAAENTPARFVFLSGHTCDASFDSGVITNDMRVYFGLALIHVNKGAPKCAPSMPPTPQKEVVMLRVVRRAGVKQSTPRSRLHTTRPCKLRAVPAW